MITGSPQDVASLVEKVKNHPDGAHLQQLQKTVKSAWHRIGLSPNDKQVAMSVKGLLRASLQGKILSDLCRKVDVANNITFLDNHRRKLAVTAAVFSMIVAGWYRFNNIQPLLNQSSKTNPSHFSIFGAVSVLSLFSAACFINSQLAFSCDWGLDLSDPEGPKTVDSPVVLEAVPGPILNTGNQAAGQEGPTTMVDSPVGLEEDPFPTEDSSLTLHAGNKAAEQQSPPMVDSSVGWEAVTERTLNAGNKEVGDAIAKSLRLKKECTTFLQLSADEQYSRFERLTLDQQLAVLNRLDQAKQSRLFFSLIVPKRKELWSRLRDQDKADLFSGLKGSHVMLLLSLLGDSEENFAFFSLVSPAQQVESVLGLIGLERNARWIFAKMSKESRLKALGKILPNKSKSSPWFELHLRVAVKSGGQHKPAVIEVPQGVMYSVKILQEEGKPEYVGLFSGRAQLPLNQSKTVEFKIPINRNYNSVKQIIEQLGDFVDITNMGYTEGSTDSIKWFLDPLRS
ncbi:MAG: hypothetical protein RLZZ453_825 [Chlamydiota bacterium]|jgi:hypothetical protein